VEGLLADKAYDADARLIEKLKAKRCTLVFPSKANSPEKTLLLILCSIGLIL
jgi:hypothetical protein